MLRNLSFNGFCFAFFFGVFFFLFLLFCLKLNLSKCIFLLLELNISMYTWIRSACSIFSMNLRRFLETQSLSWIKIFTTLLSKRYNNNFCIWPKVLQQSNSYMFLFKKCMYKYLWIYVYIQYRHLGQTRDLQNVNCRRNNIRILLILNTWCIV